jgi:ElaB/YqjD/DUF883 family membrane-anchored ribosome-binding protein
MKTEETAMNPGEGALKSAARNVTDMASKATHQLEEKVARGKARLTEMQAAVVDRTREAARTTDQYVHENPWKSIGLAAAVGVIIGMLIRRR